MNQAEKISAGRRLTAEERRERWQAMSQMKQSGMSLQQIAAAWSLTRERVRQIIVADGPPGEAGWSDLSRLRSQRRVLRQRVEAWKQRPVTNASRRRQRQYEAALAQIEAEIEIEEREHSARNVPVENLS